MGFNTKSLNYRFSNANYTAYLIDNTSESAISSEGLSSSAAWYRLSIYTNNCQSYYLPLSTGISYCNNNYGCATSQSGLTSTKIHVRYNNTTYTAYYPTKHGVAICLCGESTSSSISSGYNTIVSWRQCQKVTNITILPSYPYQVCVYLSANGVSGWEYQGAIPANSINASLSGSWKFRSNSDTSCWEVKLCANGSQIGSNYSISTRLNGGSMAGIVLCRCAV
jgi:hypothetical protein